MRVLIVTSPGIGHLFPTVSTAWALRAAGHDVLVATGGHHELAARAGLAVVDTAPGVDFGAVFGGFFAEHGPPQSPQQGSPQNPQSRPANGPENGPADGPANGSGSGAASGAGDGGGQLGLEFVARLFGVVSGKFVDGTVALAREWRPDLVLHTPLQGAGPMAAAAAGVPSVVHGIGPGHRVESFGELLSAELAADYERHGLTPPPTAATLDVSPPSMRPPGADGWPLRYVPYNGGGVLPDWLLAPRGRRRVTVTLGSVLPLMAGIGLLRPFVAAAGTVDAEFVLTLGGAAVEDLGPLPDNVRPVEWVPLGALLAASDAVVHHGGSGTLLTALDAGLPQLVLPQGADQFGNAAAAAKAGAATVLTPPELDAERLTDLLTDPGRRAAAEAVAEEMATQPTPAEVVPRLESLVG